MSVSTLSSHCKGPLRWTSIQQGVAVTVFRLYSSPHPFTNESLKVWTVKTRHTPSLPDPPDGAHAGQVVHVLVAPLDALGQQWGELLIVEDLQRAARGHLAHRGGVPGVSVIAVRRLDEDGSLTEALGEHLAPSVVELHPAPDVLPGLLHHVVPVDVAQQTQAEPLTAARVCEAVHNNGLLRRWCCTFCFVLFFGTYCRCVIWFSPQRSWTQFLLTCDAL